LTFINIGSQLTFGQDTVLYNGIIPGNLLSNQLNYTQTILFKWTSEFDLSWDEYGLYKIDKNQIELSYYVVWNRPKTMSLKDTISQIQDPYKIERFTIEKKEFIV